MKNSLANKASIVTQGVKELFRKDYHFNFDMLPSVVEDVTFKQKLELIKNAGNLFGIASSPYAMPPYCSIELTNYCNLKCPVCPTGEGILDRPPENISIELFRKVWNELSPYILGCCLWAWGEPLLHPQLSEILKIVAQSNVVTYLSTNGQNLDKYLVRHAIQIGYIKYLIIAIDGITDETNSKYRVGARLAPILEGVQQLRETRTFNLPILHMRYIVMKHNEHEVEQVPAWAKAHGFDSLSIRTLSIINDNETEHGILKPDNPEYQAYQYKDGKRVTQNNFICDKVVSFPCVMTNGEVTPCEQDWRIQASYGNLKDKSFKEIWWGKQAQQVRETIKKAPETFEFCKNCPFKDRPVNTCSIKYYDFTENKCAK